MENHDKQIQIEDPIDLCLPIYLNQQIVFDSLAILEDGFSAISTLQTTNEVSGTQKEKIEGSIGVSNVFAFLPIRFGGAKEDEKETHDHTDISKTKVHTPTSLFAKLRKILKNQGLLITIKNQNDINNLKCTQFVEMRVVLKKNPVIETVETIREVAEMAIMAQELGSINSSNTSQKGSQKSKPPQSPQKVMIEKVNAAFGALTQSNSLELVGELLDVPTEKVVLSTQIEYFNNRNASEIIDGEFVIIGKVIRIIGKDSKDTINLLRKTTFGKLGPQIVENFRTALSQPNESILLPKFFSEVPGPVIQVVPIAIFT